MPDLVLLEDGKDEGEEGRFRRFTRAKFATRGDRFGRAIQLFTAEITPSGLRKTTIHGWTSLVVVSGD
jgi:hypothetical protein